MGIEKYNVYRSWLYADGDDQSNPIEFQQGKDQKGYVNLTVKSLYDFKILALLLKQLTLYQLIYR